MRETKWAQWFEQLKKELQSNAYQSLLTNLNLTDAPLPQFVFWDEVLLFMHGGDSHDPRKDTVLYPILKAHGEVPDQRWVTILLTVFWPGLDSIFKKRRRWDPLDPDR
ncbi:MAG: hypothetical protein KJ970_16915, partial [Candidatus Eisenbacteria bacterium]|nr:hypothetical protein [Candidatus Eisenbacteria bacterium]